MLCFFASLPDIRFDIYELFTIYLGYIMKTYLTYGIIFHIGGKDYDKNEMSTLRKKRIHAR